ncbi:MAG: Crp/Fnr family transcriptional regulator [Muribaculaceae bacterium]|nr:Crp/Fnr family transcriptional regulator [Muribaculaceae bacterium]
MRSLRFNTYYDSIDLDFWREFFLREGDLLRYEKGVSFVERGHPAPYIGYIKTGGLKYVAYAADNSEHVVGLEFAGGFVADFPFSLYGWESRVSIIAVTPCEILCMSAKEIGMRLMSDEELYRKVGEATIALFDNTYDRYIDLRLKTAKERYDELIYAHKDLFMLFSLKDIASFLNITPTHLSRLRKLLNRENLKKI